MSSGATPSPRGCASAASTDRLTAVLTRVTSFGRTAIVVFEARGRSAGTGDGIGASCVSTGCEQPLSMLSAPPCVTTTSPALAGAGVAGVVDVFVVLDVSVDVVVPVSVGAEPELLPCVSTAARGEVASERHRGVGPHAHHSAVALLAAVDEDVRTSVDGGVRGAVDAYIFDALRADEHEPAALVVCVVLCLVCVLFLLVVLF